MSWLSKREKLDPVQAAAIDFAVAQEGNFYFILDHRDIHNRPVSAAF